MARHIPTLISRSEIFSKIKSEINPHLESILTPSSSKSSAVNRCCRTSNDTIALHDASLKEMKTNISKNDALLKVVSNSNTSTSTNNSKVTTGSDATPINLGTEKVVITVPMVFHILAKTGKSVDQLKNHINNVVLQP